MPKLKISRTTLKTITPPEKTLVHWDESQTGFGVRVQPSGAMSYIAAFRLKGATQLKFVTIGKVGSLTPEIARDRARDLITAARSGIDLDAQTKESVRADEDAKRSVEKRLSVAEAVKRYITHAGEEISQRTGRRLSPSTIKATRLWLSGFEKALGDRELFSIEASDLRQVISETATASRRNVSGVLKRFFAYALDCGYITSDPTAQVKRAKAPPARERTPSVDEVRKILAACDDLLTEGSWQQVQLVALKTLILTGQRRQDVTKLEWQDLDLQQGIWTQPGRKNKSGRLHTVPLSSTLLTLLREHHDECGKPSTGLVFPGIRSGREMNAWMSDANEWLRLASKVDFRLHDLRRSVVSALADNNVPFEVADAILNHAQAQSRGGLLGVYQRSELTSQKRQALELWDRLLTGTTGDVITLPTAAERRIAG